jgi:hypothetical protein
MWVARAVGFEPTIPDLETGALGQAKLRPYRRRHVAIFQNWSLGAGSNGCFLSHNQAFWPLNYRRVGAKKLVRKNWWQRTGGKKLVPVG